MAGGMLTTVASTFGLNTGQQSITGLALPTTPPPGGIATVNIPEITGVAAGATVTVQLIRTDTNAVIGNGVAQNTGAGSGAVGPINFDAVVPQLPTGATVQVQAAVSSGTATCQGSATSPMFIYESPIAYSEV